MNPVITVVEENVVKQIFLTDGNDDAEAKFRKVVESYEQDTELIEQEIDTALDNGYWWVSDEKADAVIFLAHPVKPESDEDMLAMLQ